MSTLIIEVYEAFKADGRRRIKHTRTAKAVADYEGQFNKLETQLGKMEGEIPALKIMVGIVIALNMAIIGLIVNNLIAK